MWVNIQYIGHSAAPVLFLQNCNQTVFSTSSFGRCTWSTRDTNLDYHFYYNLLALPSFHLNNLNPFDSKLMSCLVLAVLVFYAWRHLSIDAVFQTMWAWVGIGKYLKIKLTKLPNFTHVYMADKFILSCMQLALVYIHTHMDVVSMLPPRVHSFNHIT